jgi:hypothetical protein
LCEFCTSLFEAVHAKHDTLAPFSCFGAHARVAKRKNRHILETAGALMIVRLFGCM